MDKLHQDLRKRLRFIEGQARGIQNMLEQERDFADVLTQLLAIQSAARAASEVIIRDRMGQRIKEAVQRAVQQCAGECALCDELEGLSQALEQVDYATLLEDLTKYR